MAANRTTEYAVRALVVLEMEGSRGKVRQAAELAKLSGTPPKFLEQVLRILTKGGLVRSRRGAGGGYELARSAGKIRMDEVVHLVEGAREEFPGRMDPVGEEWVRIRTKSGQAAAEILHAETLDRLVERIRSRILSTGKSADYHI